MEEYIKTYREHDDGFNPIILVGNKIDLEPEREVTKEEAERFANKYEIPYFEISVKTGLYLDDPFIEATLRAI